MKKRILILLASLLLGSSSCIKDIYLDSGEKPKVVVECVLTEGPLQELYLSYTKEVSQKEADPLLEADARLIDLVTGEYSDTFSYGGAGKWLLEYKAFYGHEYLLEINVPGYNLITAQTRMPAEFTSSHISFGAFSSWLSNSSTFPIEKYKTTKYGYSGGSFFYGFPDHCWIYFINDDGSIAETICTDYPGVDDFNLTGDTYVSDVRKKPVYLGWKETPEGLESVWGEEQDAFLYPSLIGQGLHDRFLRIPKGEEFQYPDTDYGLTIDERLSLISQYYVISGSFKTERLRGTLCIESLSEEYDLYMAAAMRAAKIIGSTDISKIYLKDNILDTNIKGGLGIFGAKVQRLYDWGKVYSSIEYPML